MGQTNDKEGVFTVEGRVTEALRDATFRVELENNTTVIAKLSGRIRANRIRILLGDRVQVEMSPYDVTRGRITYRFK